jgi:hypothetical protein
MIAAIDDRGEEVAQFRLYTALLSSPGIFMNYLVFPNSWIGHHNFQ